jgi:ribosomal protein S18 acetylase RimI-like enzyme
MTDIRPLEPTAVDAPAAVLARAFAPDPMFSRIVPDPARREAGVHALVRVPLRYGLRYGRVTPPAGARRVLGAALRAGRQATARFGQAQAVMDRLHTRHAAAPHWYLLIVGVDPELRGRGVGGALVREGLARADRERLGFAAAEDAVLGEGGPPAWGMIRPAAGG